MFHTHIHMIMPALTITDSTKILIIDKPSSDLIFPDLVHNRPILNKAVQVEVDDVLLQSIHHRDVKVLVRVP